MIEDTKKIIETIGFQQLITGTTRQWRLQEDSIIDHIWKNCRNRSKRHFNETNGASDHNVIGVDIATKDLRMGGQNIVKHVWTNFDNNICLETFRNTDWKEILDETNAELTNSKFEEIFCHITDKEAPFKSVQVRTKYLSWLTAETKTVMKNRSFQGEGQDHRWPCSLGWL